MATPIRFELTIFAVTGRHVKPLHHGAVSYSFEAFVLRASNENYFTTKVPIWQVLFSDFFKKFPYLQDASKGSVCTIILHNQSYAFRE